MPIEIVLGVNKDFPFYGSVGEVCRLVAGAFMSVMSCAGHTGVFGHHGDYVHGNSCRGSLQPCPVLFSVDRV